MNCKLKFKSADRYEMYSTIFGVRPGFFPKKKIICKKKKDCSSVCGRKEKFYHGVNPKGNPKLID